jgi:hypothetical protein
MHDRSEQRRQLARKLEAGVSIHMPAPRRIGKTWTIGRLAADLRSAGWRAVEVDVQGMSTPKQFAADLCARIEEQIPSRNRFTAHVLQRFERLLGGDWGDKPLDALGRVDPIDFAETLIAALADAGEKTAIIIDEISYFFLELAQEDPKAAHTFAYQLRALQQRYKSVRWLITGSIGLDTIAHRYGLEGAFVDFETFPLEPFTKAEARSYLRDPAVQQQLNHPFDASDADFDAMFDDIGWLAPFYLKLVANEVRPSIPGTGNQLGRATKPDFDAAFERLLQPNRKSEFAVWREHVDKNLPAPDRAVAKSLLNFLSQRPGGEIEATLLSQASSPSQGPTMEAGTTRRQVRDILAMLTNDGLLMKTEQRFRFRSGLVQRYWQEYEAE